MAPGGRRVTRMFGNTQPQSDDNNVNSQVVSGAATHVEDSPNTIDMAHRRRHVPRMAGNTQARSNGSTVSSQALPDDTTHVEGPPNITEVDMYQGWLVTPKLDLMVARLVHKLYLMIPHMLRVHPTLLEKFDIDLHVGHVEKAVHKYMGIRFRDYRSRLHGYYMKLGRDANYKRSRPPSGVSQQNWEKLCVRFESDDFQKLSEQNSNNREKQEINHCAGTVSFVRYRENERDPASEQEMGRIPLYHGTHFSKKKSNWVAPAAQEKYDKMVERQSQATPEDSIPPTEDDICDEVLGKRAGYTRGLGLGVMPSSSRLDRPSMEEIQRNNEETNKRLEEAERRADDAEMRRDELSIEMVNQARKIEVLEEWKARLELFMSNFRPAIPPGMNA